MDLTQAMAGFADAVGSAGPVTIAGRSTRGGACQGVRAVTAPSGVSRMDAEELTVACGAATPVDELVAALGEVGQTIALPAGGTVGGALALGRSDHRLLGYGPIRDVLLQMHYVSAAGEVVMAGGATVKNVSGFDLCRLFVGSRGTLGFIGDVILRTRPKPRASQWFTLDTTDPDALLAALYRPTSILWDGSVAQVLLEGHPGDIAEQASAAGLQPTPHPRLLAPAWVRSAVRPADQVACCAGLGRPFVAQIGTGVVWAPVPVPSASVDPRLAALSAEVKRRFDPGARLNPGVLP